MQDPLVTIIIQTFHRKNLLTFALSSAINQTYRNIEILIGDNCSQDGTDIYCEQEAQKDSRIKYFRHSQNIGMVGNANFLCDRVNGEYVVFLNDDDWLDVDYVEKCIAFFSENPSYSLVTPSTVLYPENCSNLSATGGELCKIIKLDSNNVHSRLITYLKNQDLKALQEKLKYKHISQTTLENLTVYCGYSPYGQDSVYVDGQKANIQIAVEKDLIIVGFPLILTGY